MEIERKFLLHQLPFALDGYEQLDIEQTYISVSPVIRLRRSHTRDRVRNRADSRPDDRPDVHPDYFLTVKHGGSIAHEEAEFPLTEAQYQKLLLKAETDAVRKTRVLIPLDNALTAELDVYHGALNGLLTVEVEFESLAEAMAFTPPGWFGEDVSENAAYSNSSLAIYGRPDMG
ncbi:MAG: CYTH domain-containing protein [Clostridiales bacterium]|jgi:CYTH domain-containing protein|nr:CYTH domain-containing protein [Clostridiales bacterium]